MKDKLKNDTLYYIGISCKKWRKFNDFTISQISAETGYSLGSISNFENGQNNNVLIFIWYLAHGFNIEKDFINPFTKEPVNLTSLLELMNFAY